MMAMIALDTVLIIKDKDKDVRCEVGDQDKTTQKWAGAVNLYCDKCFQTTLIHSNYVFKSPEDAVKYTENFIKEIREMNLHDLTDQCT